MVAKFLQAFGWMGLCFIRYVPIVVSQNIGQSCLFTGLFLESLVMLDMVNFRLRVLTRVQAVIYVAVLIGFNVSFSATSEFHVRVVGAASSVFLLMLIPGVAFLVKSGHSPLRRLTGSLYVLIIISCLFRVGQSFASPLPTGCALWRGPERFYAASLRLSPPYRRASRSSLS